MKYRLKKDLPFARMGAEVQVGLSISVRNKNHSLQWIGNPQDLELLIENGWIEEVKTREFYLIPNSLPMFEPYAVVKTVNETEGYHNVIKVREVIE